MSLLDTGVFDQDRFLMSWWNTPKRRRRYAIQITVIPRAGTATLHLLPTLWFGMTGHGEKICSPTLRQLAQDKTGASPHFASRSW